MKIEREHQEINAEDRAVGRVATEVAMILRGKDKPSFAPHIDAGDFVTVINVSKVKFTGKKLEQKDYFHHTMYPGGLRRTPMKKVFDENPAEVPKNKLRNEMMKRLTIKN